MEKAIERVARHYAKRTGTIGPATPADEAAEFNPYLPGSEANRLFTKHYIAAVCESRPYIRREAFADLLK